MTREQIATMVAEKCRQALAPLYAQVEELRTKYYPAEPKVEQLTPEEVEAYRLYLRLLDTAEELHKRRYFMSGSYGSEEDNLYRIDNEEHQLEHFLMMYVLTPEEVAERKRQLGFD